MNSADKNVIVNRYRERLQAHGAGPQALATGNAERRAIRFGVLADIGELEGCSVLDIGCGLADFLAYLRERGVNVNYTGYDITPEFVAEAARRHPEATFEVRDVQTDGIPQKFDYVVSSQTFNNRLAHDDNRLVMQEVLRLAHGVALRGVAFDMITDHVDFREDRLFYYSPEEMFRFAKTLTKRVQLRHDYPLYEFALYLYPDFSGWKK
jgi:trans-aconitate methyltransferase